MKVFILNGANLGQLGTREANIYGNLSFEEYLEHLRFLYPDAVFDYFQSDSEVELAGRIAAAMDYEGVILNAGAYTHTSVLLADAVRTTGCPVIEVHISNLFGRERYRRESVLSGCCFGFIAGFGLDSYRLAVEALLKISQPLNQSTKNQSAEF